MYRFSRILVDFCANSKSSVFKNSQHTLSQSFCLVLLHFHLHIAYIEYFEKFLSLLLFFLYYTKVHISWPLFNEKGCLLASIHERKHFHNSLLKKNNIHINVIIPPFVVVAFFMFAFQSRSYLCMQFAYQNTAADWISQIKFFGSHPDVWNGMEYMAHMYWSCVLIKFFGLRFQLWLIFIQFRGVSLLWSHEWKTEIEQEYSFKKDINENCILWAIIKTPHTQKKLIRKRENSIQQQQKNRRIRSMQIVLQVFKKILSSRTVMQFE